MSTYKFFSSLYLLSLTCLGSSVLAQDDAYEPNDTLGSAYPLPEQTWLSSISGPGIQYDNDFYVINVSPNAKSIYVDCQFTHADGDIDIALLNASGSSLGEAWSETDNEFLYVTVQSGGTYYILVEWGDNGNPYDLWWNADDVSEDDAYEPNETPELAYPLPEQTWLSSISGLGIQLNDDMYEISVAPGSEQVQVDCQFTHADGNIDIALANASLTFVETSVSQSNNEFIDVMVPVAGTYYIFLASDYQGNSYDLLWTSGDGSTDTAITNYGPVASGFMLEWVPVAGWDSMVKCSTNLVETPFTNLSTSLPYPVNSYTDTVHGAEGKCFYRVELTP